MVKKNKNIESGIYVIKLIKSAFALPAGRIIYIGKGNNVGKRLSQELGIASGAATFFRTIGVMLGKKVIQGSGKNFKFYEKQEIVAWIKDNTESEIINCDWKKTEKELITEHKPPFNYIYNTQHYFPGLYELRQNSIAIGREKFST